MKSESIKELAAALSKAQGEIKNAKKDSKNPFFHSKYASLESVREVVNPVFFKYGLAVAQFPCEPGHSLKTILTHESGEWIEEIMDVSPVMTRDKEKDKQGNVLSIGDPYISPQALGSAITYARRYALMGVAGIAPEDDDGESAMGRQNASIDKRQEERENAARNVTPPTAKTWKQFVCHHGKLGGPALGQELGKLDSLTLNQIKDFLVTLENPSKQDNLLLAAIELGIKEKGEDKIPME